MISTDKAIREIEVMGFHPFHHDGGSDVVSVSTEHGDDAGDYWMAGDASAEMMTAAGFDGFGVSLKLTAWADAHGLYWEWVNGAASQPTSCSRNGLRAVWSGCFLATDEADNRGPAPGS